MGTCTCCAVFIKRLGAKVSPPYRILPLQLLRRPRNKESQKEVSEAT